MYKDSNNVTDEIKITDLLVNVATKIISRAQQSINTIETALNLGSVGTLGYVILVNLDPDNYIDLKTAASGTIIARLDAGGGFAFFKVGSGITAPVAIANTSPCVIDKLLCSL